MSHSKRGDTRREAWHRFYLEHYPEAIKAVGNEKQKIDAYIASLWKTIGSKGREFYINAARKSAENHPSPKRPRESFSEKKLTEIEAHDGRATSPIQEVKASPDRSSINQRPHEEVNPEARKRASSVERTEPTAAYDARSHADDDGGSWPRQLASRLSACVMLVRKKTKLSVGEVISLSVSPAREPGRGKQPLATVVRLSKNGREFARLDSSFATALGAAMQTKLVSATCSIVQPPIGMGMFNPFYADVSISVERDAFESKTDGERTEGMSSIRMAIIRMIRDLNFTPDRQIRHHGKSDSGETNGIEASDLDKDENYFSTVKRVGVADAKGFVQPQLLRSTLREYQKVGVMWMKNRENFGSSAMPSDQTGSACFYPWERFSFEDGGEFFLNAVTGELCLKNASSENGGSRGGILADEMGLGKTVQCIACLLQDFDEVPCEDKNGRTGRITNKKAVDERDNASRSVSIPPTKKRKRSTAPEEDQGTSAMSLLMTNAKDSCMVGGTLIVCPTSLVTQWMDELKFHVHPKSLRVLTHYGNYRGDETSICAKFADVVVTSYGVLSSEYRSSPNDSDSVIREGPLFKLHWRRVILDEAHTIKSRGTRWAKAAYLLKAEKRWCITGTVIHNHINDVFSLIHFLRLEPWSNWRAWTKSIADPLESKDEATRESAMSLVRDILSSIILRRKKSTKDSEGKPIVQMTKKTVEIVSITPSREEQEFYSALHARTKLKFNSFLAQGNVLKNYASVLEMLLRLRQACDHPYLVVKAANSRKEVKFESYKDFADSCDFDDFMTSKKDNAGKGEKVPVSQECPICLDITDSPVRLSECGHVLCHSCLTEALQDSRACPLCKTPTDWKDPDHTADTKHRTAMKMCSSSAKIEELIRDLHERHKLRSSHGREVGKTVVFSQFSSMLDIVETALHRARFAFLRIDGTVPQSKRATILRQFGAERELANNACNVLLLTTRTGGVGLNLTSASLAIILDIHWNPQVDAQAEDRIHRHGQTRDVVIKRYIVKDSVEENLLEVQARKEKLAEGALEEAKEGDEKQARLAELQLLFSR